MTELALKNANKFLKWIPDESKMLKDYLHKSELEKMAVIFHLNGGDQIKLRS